MYFKLMSTATIENHRVRSRHAANIALTAANAFGIALYLKLASGGWRIPEEHGVIPVSGEPFVWASALPVLGFFLLIDIIWVSLLIRSKRWTGMWWCLLTAAMWLGALCIDFAHH